MMFPAPLEGCDAMSGNLKKKKKLAGIPFYHWLRRMRDIWHIPDVDQYKHVYRRHFPFGRL